ncbi:MAG: hypothetical protein H6905_05395 [Hyphomicrobiales bacterium]|nr:hypothetical protein [Hyphomicrobiales bacterium]
MIQGPGLAPAESLTHTSLGAESTSPLLPRYLLLGVDDMLSATAGLPCAFVTDNSQPFDGIIATDGIDPRQVSDIVRETGAVLAPIASLGSMAIPFADYRADGQGTHGWSAMNEAVAKLGQIVGALRRLPATVRAAADTETILLARAYTRGGRLEPRYEPQSRALVIYPAAGPIEEPWRQSDQLADDGAFTRTFFDRFHICPDCSSSRMNVREECPACRSSDVFEEDMVHHFRCAHQAFERDFRQSGDLVCPKCHHQLRHVGIDYDRPGAAISCRACGHVNAEPSIGFACLDCGARNLSDHVGTRDIHSYALTALGEHWLFHGEEIAVRRRADDRMRAFRTLVDHGLKIQGRYGRPAQVLRVTFTAAAEVRRIAGEQSLARARAHAAEVMRNELRTCDYVVETEDGLLAYLPETDGPSASIPRSRLAEKINEALTLKLGVKVDSLDLSDIAAAPAS